MTSCVFKWFWSEQYGDCFCVYFCFSFPDSSLIYPRTPPHNHTCQVCNLCVQAFDETKRLITWLVSFSLEEMQEIANDWNATSFHFYIYISCVTTLWGVQAPSSRNYDISDMTWMRHLILCDYILLKMRCVCLSFGGWKEKNPRHQASPTRTPCSIHELYRLVRRGAFGIGRENGVDLLSALSHLILFQRSLTHHCLIYKRPFNIHACLGDISQTLWRRPEIYWICVLFPPLFCFVYLQSNNETENLFCLVLKSLPFTSQ